MFEPLFILILLHAAFMLYSTYGWRKALDETAPGSEGKGGALDVVIPFRNEEQTLPLLLSDLQSQVRRTDLSMVIMVNDSSEDASVRILREFEYSLPLTLLDSSSAGKKSALSQGLASANTEHVVLFDADVRLSKYYFKTLAEHSLQGVDMLILPVVPHRASGFWESYAAMDFMALIGMTFSWAALGRPVMANGANMIIRRDQFEIESETASGDDIQNLHRLKKVKGTISVSLHRDLEAQTRMPTRFKDFLSQRVRWAAKSSEYKDADSLIMAWYMLLHNVSFIAILLLGVYRELWPVLFIGLLLKGMIDFSFLALVAKRFDRLGLLWIYPLAAGINLLLWPCVFLLSRFGTFDWKGRTYTK